MSFLSHFTKPSDRAATIPMNYDATGISANPEPVGTILGKVSIIWAGLFAGIKLGDVVLIATLVYTILQIGLAVYERIIKPIRALQEATRSVKAAAAANTASQLNLGESASQSGPQEK